MFQLSIVYNIMMFFFLLMVLFLTSWLLSNNYSKYKLKISMFESGFDSFNLLQISYSLNFFFIMLIFVLFDLEIILLLGFILFFKFYYAMLITLLIFIVLTFILEWKFKKLNWMI